MYKSIVQIQDSNYNLKSYQHTLVSRIILYSSFLVYNHPSLYILLIFHFSCYDSNDWQEEIIHSIRVQILKTTASQSAAPLSVPIFKVKNQFNIFKFTFLHMYAIFYAYNTRYRCTLSTSNITEDYFTIEPITRNPASIDSNDPKTLKPSNNHTNPTDTLQTDKKMIHTDIIKSTLNFLSNLNGIITRTEKAY